MAQTWLLTKSQQAPATIAQYRVATNFWIKLLGADCRIDTLQYAALASKIGGYLWPSAKTHNNYLIALRGILKLHYRGSLTMSDPSAGIENATVIKKLPDPLTRQERDMILEDMRKHCDERVYAYFLWAFSTGMRPEETIAIRWSDIDFSRKTAKVQRVRTFKGSERDGSKTHAEREIDLTDGAIEALKIMTPWTAMLHVKRVGDDDTNHDIFQNPVTRRAWHDERSQRDHYWRPTLKRLGIRWRRAYNTRHTFATLALMGDVKPAYIAAQLGHSVKVLLEKYARWISSNDTGSEKARLNASMGNLYPECTQEIC
jgi:integrase